MLWTLQHFFAGPLLDIVRSPADSATYYLHCMLAFLDYLILSPEYDDATCRHWVLQVLARAYAVRGKLDQPDPTDDPTWRRLRRTYRLRLRWRGWLLGRSGPPEFPRDAGPDIPELP